MIALYRLGASMPAPSVNYKNINTCLQRSRATAGVYALINLFSGGALLQLSVFALGIMPYITASIIIQLLVVVIPRFEQLKKEGQSGQEKLTQYSRYLTIAPGHPAVDRLHRAGPLRQLFPQLHAARSSSYDQRRPDVGTLVLTMTAGTAVIMWLGELITDRGVGNGMCVLMFTSIAARIPQRGPARSCRTQRPFVVHRRSCCSAWRSSSRWSSSSRPSGASRSSTRSA